MAVQAVDSIHIVARRCSDRLTAISARKDLPPIILKWADDQAARLRVWNAALGVYARGRMSIAYRLRLNAPVASMILQLLEGVESCLIPLLAELLHPLQDSKAYEALNRLNSVERNGSIGTAVQKIASLLNDAKANLDLLLDIAADIRKLGTQKEEQRALRFDPVDHEGNSLTQDFKQYILIQCRLHLVRTRAAIIAQDESESSEMAHTTSERISGMEISNGTSLAKDEFILGRLQATILQRWRLLCYRAHHSRVLAYDGDSKKTASEAEEPEATGRVEEAPEQIASESKGKSPVESTGTVESSAATEMTEGRLIAKRPVEEQTAKSVSTRSSGVALKEADFPRQPRIVGEETLCTLCWIPMPAKDLQGRKWRSHVLRDLSPYICVFSDCNTAAYRYKTTKLLRQHMNDAHCDVRWACPRCETSVEDHKNFDDPALFTKHLKDVHKQSISESDMQFILEHAVERTPHSLQACVFCNGHGRDEQATVIEHWDELFTHMTRDHMQSLAMLSLPWDLDVSDRASDTRQSGVESSIERMEEEIESEADEVPRDQGIVIGMNDIVAGSAYQPRSAQKWLDEVVDDRLEGMESSEMTEFVGDLMQDLDRVAENQTVPDADLNVPVVRLRPTDAGYQEQRNFELSLYNAADRGDTKKVKSILESRLSIGGKLPFLGEALQAASHGGSEEIVRILLDAGASPNVEGRAYGNPLQAAAATSSKSASIVRMLLDAGADVNAKGGLYGSALQAASYSGSTPVVRMLLDAGADVNFTGGIYHTALQAAAAEGRIEIVKLLLNKGADINARGERYGNALESARSGGHTSTEELLLERGATDFKRMRTWQTNPFRPKSSLETDYDSFEAQAGILHAESGQSQSQTSRLVAGSDLNQRKPESIRKVYNPKKSARRVAWEVVKPDRDDPAP